MKLRDLFPASALLFDIDATDKDAAIRRMLSHLVSEEKLSEDQAGQVERDVQSREDQGSTGIGNGLAIPHAKNSAAVEGILGVFARTRMPIPYDSVDGEPVQVLFLVVSGTEYADVHVEIMRRIARIARDDKTLRYLATNADAAGAVEIFQEFDDG